MRKGTRFCLLVAAAYLALTLTSYVRADDMEYWMKYAINVKVAEKATVFVKPQFRWRDEVSENYLFRTWLGVNLNVLKWLDIAPQYSYKTSKHTGDHWPPEHFLALDITPKVTLATFKISDRNRIMYNFNEYIWTYRNRIKIARPFKGILWGHGLTPFFADEIFYDDDHDEFYDNRAEVGLGTKLTENVGLELSYIYRTLEKKDKWIKSQIITSMLNLNF
jgi:hypothetical protein